MYEDMALRALYCRVSSAQQILLQECCAVSLLARPYSIADLSRQLFWSLVQELHQ